MDCVTITDVGPRDGLQNEPVAVPSAERVGLINALVDAGLPAVEVASFSSPRAVPKMAGAEEVVAGLDLDRAEFSALVPNRFGYERARAAGARSVVVVLAATETMNARNINMGLEQALAMCRDVLQQARHDGLYARAGVAVAFECPFEGEVADADVERLAAAMFAAGAQQVVIADTIGAGNPKRAKALFGRLAKSFAPENLAAHLHDTRALALANAWQAVECGIRSFDASVGGLGGCPFAPGAAGNLATEDLVSLLHQAGLHTGVDPAALLGVVETIGTLVGRPVGGRALPWLQKQYGAHNGSGGERA